MSHVYDNAKLLFGQADLDLPTTHDFRMLMVMSNSTADTELDKLVLITGGTAFTTLDEMDGTNYARLTLTSETFVIAANQADYDAADWSITALGAGTRDVIGIVMFRFVTADTDHIPVLYINTGGFPFTATGADVPIAWSATGILNFT